MRDVAASLGIAESCLHRWKFRDLLDRGVWSLTPEQIESAALAAARARIAELETKVKILRKAAAAVEQVVPPKARFALVAELAGWDVAEETVQAPVIVPVDPLHGGVLDVVVSTLWLVTVSVTPRARAAVRS